MRDEKLIRLGEEQRRDYRAFVLDHPKNWFYIDFITTDDLNHYNRALCDAHRLIQVGLDFSAMGMAVSTGYPTLDWGVVHYTQGPGPIMARTRRPLKRRLFERGDYPGLTAGKAHHTSKENRDVDNRHTIEDKPQSFTTQLTKTDKPTRQQELTGSIVKPDKSSRLLVPESNSYNIVQSEAVHRMTVSESDTVKYNSLDALDQYENHSLLREPVIKAIIGNEVINRKQTHTSETSSSNAENQRTEAVMPEEVSLLPGKEVLHRPVKGLGDLAFALNSGPPKQGAGFEAPDMLHETNIEPSAHYSADSEAGFYEENEGRGLPVQNRQAVSSRPVDRAEDVHSNIATTHYETGNVHEYYDESEERDHTEAARQPIPLTASSLQSTRAYRGTKHPSPATPVENNQHQAISTEQSPLDMDDLMDELTRRIQREYKRFYRS